MADGDKEHHDVDDRNAVIDTTPERSRLTRSFSELSIPEATCFSNAKVACCCDAWASCVVVGTLANKIAQNLPFLTSKKEYSARFSWLIHIDTALLLIACKN